MTRLFDSLVYHAVSTNHGAWVVAGVLVVGVSAAAGVKYAERRAVRFARVTHLGMEGEE